MLETLTFIVSVSRVAEHVKESKNKNCTTRCFVRTRTGLATIKILLAVIYGKYEVGWNSNSTLYNQL